MNNPTSKITSSPKYPYYNKKERTTYVAGGSSYISFPLIKQENIITHKKPTTAGATTTVSSSTTQQQQPHKPFRCHECGQTFSRSHNLKSHSATHSLVRPYKCDTCSREFRRLHDLKRHQKLHTGERPYVCSTCDRSFSRLDALNRHLKAEISCDRSKRANTMKEKSVSTPVPTSSSLSPSMNTTTNNEPRRSSAPTLPSFQEQQQKRTTLLPPILFSSFDSLVSQKSLSPPPSTALSIDHRAETDQLKRQIHDLQVEVSDIQHTHAHTLF
ncbi:hypothetical protein BDA99DRAFT_440550 [Phascolomyces articulosus]|uniref:C2H2-type domain-containing protein n=1 Tax=Phascolomyces articulosus TaxID=60185 RepID=A0AAD5PCE2_9FUNG|nr:hypothetical protein BDA99DRAFT_440550 [Phascolomyces articulosus]